MLQQHSPQMHFEFAHLTIPPQHHWLTSSLYSSQSFCRGLKVLPSHTVDLISFSPETSLISFCIYRADSCSEEPTLLPWLSVNNVHEVVPLNLISQPQLTRSDKTSPQTFLFAFQSQPLSCLKSLVLLRKGTDMHIYWHEMTRRWSHTRILPKYIAHTLTFFLSIYP